MDIEGESRLEADDASIVGRIAQFITESFQLRRCKRYVKIDSSMIDEFSDKANIKETDCACGHPFEWHSRFVQQIRPVAYGNEEPRTGPWSYENDTFLRQCDSFGQLYFMPGEGVDSSSIFPGASACYIRLPGRNDSNPNFIENVYRLMTAKNLWSLPVPQLLIEVAGTKPKKSTYVDKDVLDRFNDGIINASKAANAWIITGGTNRGVMRLVGDAVAKSRTTSADALGITCIGIVPWGVVNHREQLVNFEQSTNRAPPTPDNPQAQGANGINLRTINGNISNAANNQTQYIPVDVLTENWTTEYVVEQPEACKNGVPLNPGHNCFLFVDNARDKRFGEEVAFKGQFLSYMSQKPLYGTGNTAVTKTPVVLLVVGGGTNTLALVEQSISSKENDTPTAKKPGEVQGTPKFSRPVVLLSGLFMGASDLLTFAYNISAPSSETRDKPFSDAKFSSNSKLEQSHFASDFDERLRQHAAFEEIMAPVPESKRKDEEIRALAAIRNCLKYRSMITVVNLLEDSHRLSLDSAILDAIFKSNFGSPATTFELAQLWDRGDVAKQILRQHDDDVRKHVDMKRALTRAILYGQTEFVKLFIDDGHYDLKSYLTIAQMKNIYTELFIHCKGKAGKSSAVRLFRSLLMRRTDEDELSQVSTQELLKDIGAIFANLVSCYTDNIYTHERFFKFKDLVLTDSVMSQYNKPFETSIRDIFLLQLLLCHQNLALYFFKIGHDHIGTSLMAVVFLKSLSKEARRLDMTDLAITYSEQSTEWQDRAIDLLALCYEQDPYVCGRLLRRSLLTWQGLTILEMAYFGDRKRIMEQPAVQTALSQIWLGQMATFTRSFLIYLTLIPPLTPFLIFRIRFEHRSAVTDKSQSRPKNAKKKTQVANIIQVRSKDAPNLTEAFRQNGWKKQQRSGKRMRPLSGAGIKLYEDIKLTKPSLFNPNKPGRISVFRAIYLLYSAPITKYITHSVFYWLFLLLFSLFILDGINESAPEIEYAIWFTCGVYLLDNIRQGFGQYQLNIWERAEDFFRNMWILADLCGFTLVAASIILRFALNEADYVYAHTTYATACTVFWLRSLRIFFIAESLGPKVFTLFKMMKDLVFFLVIYIMLLLTFSTPIYCLMYPDRSIDSIRVYFALLVDISYDRMWNLFVVTMDNSRYLVEGTCRNARPNDQTLLVDMKQQVRMDDGSTIPAHLVASAMDKFVNSTYNGDLVSSSGGTETVNEVVQTAFRASNIRQVINQPCSQRNVIAIILYIIYLLLTNICVLNMLIAMFAHTVDKTRSSATRLWRFNIFRFLQEYYFRPVLPGPLMIFELVFRFTLEICDKIAGSVSSQNSDLKESYPSLDDYEYRRLEIFEKSAVETLLGKDITQGKMIDSNGRVISKLHVVQDRLHAKIDGLESRVAEALEKIILNNAGPSRSQEQVNLSY